MTETNPYEGSPYDASGMPLSTETADYDNYEDIAKTTVTTKVPTYPENINQIDYSEAKLETGDLISERGFNSAIAEDVNSGHPEFEAVDMADTGAKRKLYVKEAVDEGYTSIQELPKMESEASVEKMKADIRQEAEDNHDDDFLAKLDEHDAKTAEEQGADGPKDAPADGEATPVNKDSSMKPAEPQPLPKDGGEGA